MALMLAIIMLVVITLLVIGGFFTSTQEFRGGRNALVEQRSFAVAEYGLNAEVSDWNTGRNLPPTAGGMAVGATDELQRYVADGDTAFVSVTRLNDNTFWVISDGRASMGALSQESRRRTNALVRLAYPTLNPDGAITSAGNVTLTGASEVTGNDTPPVGWGCGATSPTVAAINAAPGANIDFKPGNITSSPEVTYTDAAADSNTYVRYGSETWNSLAANADIHFAGGTWNMDMLPIGDDTTCTASQTNWGEPQRPGIAGCYGRFPIIYSAGSMLINSNGRGQGILLVDGDLRINGKVKFYGIIIVRDNIIKGKGTAELYGAVYVRDAALGDGSTWTGTQDVHYSRCAIENALRGSAILTRVKERHWSMLY